MIRLSKFNKLRGLAVIEDAFRIFLLDKLPPDGQRDVMSHLEWMKKQPNDMNVICTLNSIPETQTTQLTISVNFLQSPAIKQDA